MNLPGIQILSIDGIWIIPAAVFVLAVTCKLVWGGQKFLPGDLIASIQTGLFYLLWMFSLGLGIMGALEALRVIIWLLSQPVFY